MTEHTPLKRAILLLAVDGVRQSDIARAVDAEGDVRMDPGKLSRIANGLRCSTSVQEAIARAMTSLDRAGREWPVDELFPSLSAERIPAH